MFQGLNCFRRKDSLVRIKTLSVTAYTFPGHYGLSICLRLPQFLTMGDVVTRRREKFGHEDGVHGPLRARPTMSCPVHLGDLLKGAGYRILRKLGYGVYFTVWLAVDGE